MSFEEDWDIRESSESMNLDLGAKANVSSSRQASHKGTYLDSFICEMARILCAVVLSGTGPSGVEAGRADCANTVLAQASSRCMLSYMYDILILVGMHFLRSMTN